MIIFETQEFTGKSMASDETEQSLDFSEQFLWQSVISCYEAGSLSWQDYFYFDTLYLGQCEESHHAPDAVLWQQNNRALHCLFEALEKLCRIFDLKRYAAPGSIDDTAWQMQFRNRRNIFDIPVVQNLRDISDEEPKAESNGDSDIMAWLSGKDRKPECREKKEDQSYPPWLN